MLRDGLEKLDNLRPSCIAALKFVQAIDEKTQLDLVFGMLNNILE